MAELCGDSKKFKSSHVTYDQEASQADLLFYCSMQKRFLRSSHGSLAQGKTTRRRDQERLHSSLDQEGIPARSLQGRWKKFKIAEMANLILKVLPFAAVKTLAIAVVGGS